MADKTTQADTIECGIPTPLSIRSDERRTIRVWYGNTSPADRQRDLASALREMADTLDAEADDLQ